MNDEMPAAVVSDAWQYPGASLDPWIPDLIERDRPIMAARPGVLRKLLPIRIDDSGVFSGGCYLIDTIQNAAAFQDWVTNDFVLDGKNFFDRDAFLEAHGHLWHVAGIEDFEAVETSQHLMRFQRWAIPRPSSAEELRVQHWPTVRAHAQQAGLTSAWLLYSPDPHHPQAGLVLAAKRPASPSSPAQLPSLSWLEQLASPGAPMAGTLGATKVFDRTSWIYTVWFPVTGTNDKHPLFPNSPPLPSPSAVGSST